MAAPGSKPLIAGEVIDLLARNELKGLKDDFHALSGKVDNGFVLLSQKIDVLRTPQYGLIVSMVGIGITLLAIIGGFAYWPIQREQNDVKEIVKTLAAGVVYQRRYEDNQSAVAKLLDKFEQAKANKETVDVVNRDQDRRMDGLAGRIREIERKFEIRTSRSILSQE